MGTERKLLNRETRKKVREGTRRLLTAAMALVLALGNVFGMLAPAAAYADDGYTFTFDNGNSVWVSSDGSTITGYATLSGNWYDTSVPVGRYGNMTMPDGTVLKAECYEVYINNPNHGDYNVPANGTYPFTATRQSDGGYFILMHTGSAAPVPGALYNLDKVQRTYTTTHWFARVKAEVKVVKVSANPSITNGNDCYSLKGAEFTVYDSNNSSVGTLTTDANGNTGTLALLPGTYTLRETKAPAGYLKAADQTFTVTNSKTLTITVKDPPASDPMTMVVGKYDGDKTYTELQGNLPQGSASLAGAEFTVEYYDTLAYDSYDALKSAGVKPTRSWVVATNERGYASLSASYLVSGDAFYYENGFVTLPRGTVVVYESKAPEGYILNSKDASFQKIQENPTTGVITYNMPEVPESVMRGGVSVQKRDTETGTIPQGGGTLEGITFSIINDNGNSVIVGGKEYASGETVTTIVTDEKGRAATADDALPYGSYIIRETATNDAYLITAGDIHATVSKDGTVYSFIVSDDIVRGGIEFDKRDIESGLDTTLGAAASFDGTEFEIRSLNDNPVIVEGVTYGGNDVVKTLTVKDGHVSTSADLLPYGDYSLKETKASEGYNLNGAVIDFSISEDGALVNPFAGTDGAAQNQVKRSDLEFTKKGTDTADRLAGIPFKITSNATGESHVGVTDENGYFSSASSWNKHTENTNGNDWALEADGVIDSSKLDMEAGIWFGLTTEGWTTAADDALGALPYDTYTIEELRCTSNEGYQLIKTSVVVSRDGRVYDFGTLDDVKAEITTFAYDALDGDSCVGVGDVTVADKVTYASLIPGRDYKLVAELHDAATGDILKDGDGKAISAEKTFTAKEASGIEVIELPISTYDLAGGTITVYERLYDAGGSLIAEHTDKDDASQQVTVIEPEIGTTAQDGADGDKTVSTDDEVAIVDTVAYKNLIPGREYTLKGVLMVKKTDKEGNVTQEALEVGGKPVTAEATFTPEAADGTVNVAFTFDSLALADGTQLVAFETLSHNGHDVAVHADIEDLGQTVTVKSPDICTSAYDAADLDKELAADDEATVVDSVEYKNLNPGKEYTVKGTLMIKKTDDEGSVTEEALKVDGKPVTAETTFTPEAADGIVNVTFTFDSRALEEGTDLVVFETLERNGNELAVHADIEDKDQTVITTQPHIRTTAVDGMDADKEVVVDDEATVVDTVAYQNLVPGKEYTVKGTLMIKKTGYDGKVSGEALKVDGEPVVAEAVFTPETSNGTVDVTFTFDARGIKDKTELVAFESLERGGVEIAAHADIEDKGQTVIVTRPEIGTTAVDSLDGDKTIVVDDETVITDTVSYTGLIPGKEYTVKGTLMVKGITDEGGASEDPLLVDGEPVTAETTFTPNKADGTVDVVFTFDSRLIPHGTEIVAFESLERAGVEIAVHADIRDKAQTVTAEHPHISTSATDSVDGDKTVVTDDETTVIDTVEYKGLLPGKEYTVSGTLMVKETGEPLEIDGEPVTGSATFTSETADGKVDVAFTFDTRAIEDGTDLVVFESLARNGVEIAEHKDIEDEGQTVTVIHPTIGTTAADGHDGDKNVITDSVSTIVDTVAYKNLIPGKEYTLKGTLIVKGEDDDGEATEEPLLVDGEPVTAEATFTPEKSEGTVDVTFTFDSTAVPHGTELVAFESLERVGVEIAIHADIEDEGQTTTSHVTAIGTTASDGLDGDKTVIADAEAAITDDVAYENALTGVDYTMAGLLIDAETGLPILTGDGSEKYSQSDVAAFMQQLLDVLGLSSTHEGGEGYLEVPLSQETEGDVTISQSIRVFSDGAYEVVDSENGFDEDGLGFANVGTSGKVPFDELTEEQQAAVSDMVAIPEAGIVLDYSGCGELPADIDMDAMSKLIADNADLLSHMVYGTAAFTPEKYDGTVSIDYTFDANDVIDRLAGETKDIVVFEVMLKGGFDEGSAPVIVASECDLDSEEQTVKLVPSAISTTATDKTDGDHELLASKDSVVVDTVEYEGLIPGKEYTLKATLMDKETGEPLTVADKTVTAELKFTPNAQSGTIDIELGEFDTSELDGHDLVVFEELHKQHLDAEGSATDILVAEHKDIEDEGQTVTVTITPPGSFFGKTGGSDLVALVALAVLAALAGGAALYAAKSRKKAAEDAVSDGDAGMAEDTCEDTDAGTEAADAPDASDNEGDQR
ncbi:VaFE repeat-containing surface-anchored protein [Rubneribacter sp.]